MKNITYKIFIGLCYLLLVQNLQAQVWYRAEMQSVRGYNNDCDFGANEEGEFEVRISDNINYGAWSYSGCMECDGNMNNGTGVTCTRTNLIRDQIYTTGSAIRFQNRGQEDDGFSNCDWNDDCVDDWGDQQDITLTSIPQNAWQSYTRTRSSRWQMTYRLIWNYAVPTTGNASLTAIGIVSDGYGEVNSYVNNMDGSLTIYPVNSCQRVRVTFNAFDTETNYDYVYIYNGNSTSAPLLSQTSGSTLPGTQVSTAKDGSLTVRFTSDGSVTYSGFRFTITNEDYPTPPGNPATFGSNTWNVYGYCNNNINLSGVVYRGFYTEAAESYNSATRWTNSPSDASGWSGNALRDDYHTVVAKRQGFTPGYYTLSIPNHDDDIRIYINGTQVYEFIGCCATRSCVWAGTLDATSTIEVRHIDGVGGSQQAITLTPTINPTTFGSNQWNVYAYNGSAFNNHFGYYTTNRTNEFNLGADGMGATSNPSVITGGTINGATVGGYVGCGLGNDAWSISAKRQGFPCAVYNINMVNHDDDYLLNIDFDGNGTVDFTTSGGCCNVANGTKWTGVLTSASRIEIQLREGTGDAYIDVDFVNITTTLQGGTIAGITDGVSICNGADPGAFTSSAAASAGTSAVFTGGTSTYQWESSTTSVSAGFSNIGGASGVTYDPGTLTQTTWFRRRATDACGTVAYSNVIQVTVRPTPTASIGGTTTVCQNGTAPNITFTNPQSLPVTITYNINGSGTTMVNVGANTTATVAAPTTTPGSFAYNLVSVAYQTAPSCSNAITSTATLTVNPSHTLALSSASTTTTQTVCQSTAISPIVYAVGGGGGGAGVTGLPFGVTGNFASGNFTISGTPTQSGTFNYTVTTTGNGCTVATATGTITVHAALVLTSSGTNVSCNGGTNGTASVTASGGTGTYTYSWYSGGSSSSLSGLGAGTYTVLVTSGACSATTSYTVTQPSAIIGSASAGASILCNGGTTTLTATASGGTGALQYSLNGGAYQSSNSFTVGAGTHTITVKDANNCTQALAAVVVSQPSALVAKTCTNANDLCQVAQGQIKVVVSGGVAPYNVAWSPTHGTPSSPQSIGASGGAITISGLQGGVTYTFVVTDANGCVAP